jgi:hypothetical protein
MSGGNKISSTLSSIQYICFGKHYAKHPSLNTYRRYYITSKIFNRLAKCTIFAICTIAMASSIGFIKKIVNRNIYTPTTKTSFGFYIFSFDVVFFLYAFYQIMWRVSRYIISEINISSDPVPNIDTPAYLIAIQSKSPSSKYIATRKLLQVSQALSSYERTPLTTFQEV